jgi:hypothetical protein
MYRLKLVWADNTVTFSQFWETPEFFRVPVRLPIQGTEAMALGKSQWKAVMFKREGETQTYHEVPSENS